MQIPLPQSRANGARSGYSVTRAGVIPRNIKPCRMGCGEPLDAALKKSRAFMLLYLKCTAPNNLRPSSLFYGRPKPPGTLPPAVPIEPFEDTDMLLCSRLASSVLPEYRWYVSPTAISGQETTTEE